MYCVCRRLSCAQVALDVVQHATASMGKFDKVRSKADAPRALKKQRVRPLDCRVFGACICLFTPSFPCFSLTNRQSGNEFNKSLAEEKDSALGIFNRLMGKSSEKNSFDVNAVRLVCLYSRVV